MDEMTNVAPHVLLVEDDDDTRGALFELFRAQGWAVDEACDGEEALRRLDARGYDLVVTDFWLREFNGAQIVAYMHAIGNAPPVLMMSAMPQGLAVPGVCAADVYLRKPFSLDQILEAARNLIAQGQRVRRGNLGSGTFAFRTRAQQSVKTSK
jgi:two-component system OmpR family response regulator